jgi:hypothetical protein
LDGIAFGLSGPIEKRPISLAHTDTLSRTVGRRKSELGAAGLAGALFVFKLPLTEEQALAAVIFIEQVPEAAYGLSVEVRREESEQLQYLSSNVRLTSIT